MKIKNFGKKAMAAAVSGAMLLAMAPMAFSASSDIDYKINNPYDGVNFATYKPYKADLHSHTTFSDGSNPLPEMVERHYELGFDILAVTDHGTDFYGYTVQNQHHVPAMKILGLIDNGEIIDDVLAESGTAANGNSYKVTKSDVGDEYYTQTGADGKQLQSMLAVPYANEQNPTSFNNAHVNTWFVEYGHGRVGGTSDYATPIRAIQGLGGLCVINHPGEYTNARDEIYTADAYNKEEVSYSYKINKFESLLLENSNCIGIDVNSKGDGRTRFDRKLWDIMLADIVPYGRSVYAIATSDAHNLDIADSGYTVHYMESNTSENLRANMANGEFFAGSKYVGNFDELVRLRDGLKTLINPAAADMITTLDNIIAQSEAEMADGGEGQKYEAPKDIPAPLFTNVVVDDTADVIALACDNELLVHWIADGEVIHVGNIIDLDDYSDKIGSYVRAEAYGYGGVMYTQAFTLEYDGAPEAEEREAFVDLGHVVTAICDVPVRILLAILPLNLIAEIFG